MSPYLAYVLGIGTGVGICVVAFVALIGYGIDPDPKDRRR